VYEAVMEHKASRFQLMTEVKQEFPSLWLRAYFHLIYFAADKISIRIQLCLLGIQYLYRQFPTFALYLTLSFTGSPVYQIPLSFSPIISSLHRFFHITPSSLRTAMLFFFFLVACVA
jgi:hypothetical protein